MFGAAAGDPKSSPFAMVHTGPRVCGPCSWKSPKRKRLRGAAAKPAPANHSATGRIKLFANEENSNVGKKIVGKGNFTLCIQGAFLLNDDGAFNAKITEVFDAQKT